MDVTARDKVMALIEERNKVEREIKKNLKTLENNSVGMTDSLVCDEGFPRCDINVVNVRHARQRIICLRNDCRDLMKRIQQSIEELHAGFIDNNGRGTFSNESAGTNTNNMEVSNDTGNGSTANEELSFAAVGFVHEGSPAHVGGLHENDEVIQFGSIRHNNFNDITQLHNLVMNSVSQPIQVRVRRGGCVQDFTIVPQHWAKAGFLGCMIRRLY